MMTSNDELLTREQTAWEALIEVAAATPAERRGVEGVVPGWSVHDVLWHCVYWADYAGLALERLNAGDSTEPDEDSEADILAAGRAMTWDELSVKAGQARERVRAALSATAEINAHVLEVFSSETFDHYDEHAVEIRSFNS